MTSSINIALERAVDARNFNEVKILIAAGADINHTLNKYLDTMLHKAKNSCIARDLLGFSADIHAKNLFNRTPLHSVVIDGKPAELVQTLIEHGPNVDARDSNGHTPLHYAVESKNVDVIKCLVMNNANISYKQAFDDLSPLCSAMMQEDLTGVKALVRYTLLRNFNDNYTTVIDLHNYFRMKNFFMVRTYVNQCGKEILKMKDEKMSDEVSLFQIIRSKCVPIESLYKDPKGMELFTKRSFEVLSSNKYPYYHDVIIEKIKSKLQISSLRKMLNIVQISANMDSNKEHLTLNQDIISVLAKYLFKNDLFNLILASFEPCNHETASQDLIDINYLKRNAIDLKALSASLSFSKRMKIM